MGMTDPVPTFSYLVTELLARHPDLAYLHVTEKRLGTATPGGDIVSDDVFSAEGTENDFIRAIWSAAGKALVTAGGYTRETGMNIAQRKGDFIAYGRLFISNVRRFMLEYERSFADMIYSPTLHSACGRDFR